MGKQPGVMLYFEIRPCLERLTMEEQGQLFRAILDYGEEGIEPNFDYMLGIAWDFIKPRLERDRERYEEVSRKRAEAAQARWAAYHASAESALQTMPTATSAPNPDLTSASLSAAVTTPPFSVQQIVENSPQNKDFS